MLIIELNEFSVELLKRASRSTRLPAITHVLEMQRSKTVAVEKEERYGLDPWVQWVSIHTGKTAGQHRVLHLGDGYNLQDKQLWEVLAEQGKSFGVWGCMNAKYRDVPGCDFFFPDPWTFSEPAYPEELNGFLSLPRYYAKHYLELGKSKLLKASSRTLWFLLKNMFRLLPFGYFMLANLFKVGFNSATLFALFDLVNAICFRHYRNKYKSDTALIFLNSIAHYQHHRWMPGQSSGKQEVAFFRIVDKALEVIIDAVRDGEPILVTNAFSQVNTADRGDTLYRQTEPARFFKALGLPSHEVEQLMTNDSQLIFSCVEDRQAAEVIISSLTIDDKPAFQVDLKEHDPSSLFCQFIIWDDIAPDAVISGQDELSLEFYRYFQRVTVRTGSHVQEGDLYYRNIEFPESLENHEIFHHVLGHFGVNNSSIT